MRQSSQATKQCPLCGGDGIPLDARFCPLCEQLLPIPPTLDFSKYVTDRTRDFTGREWVFRAIDRWLADPEGSRVFLLTGEPGCGKSAIAARLVQFSQGVAPPPEGLARLAPGFLSALHFCSAGDHRRYNPHIFTESLALQLSRYPEYASVLATLPVTAHGQQQQPIQVIHQDIKQINNQGQAIGILNIIEHLDVRGAPPEVAFVRLVMEPLVVLCRERPRQQIVILVDALDEALIYSGEVSIVGLLARSDLPRQVRFLVTSRPDPRVAFQLGAPALDLRGDTPAALDDMIAYANHRLTAYGELRHSELANRIVDISKGSFLYASLLLDAIARGEDLETEIEDFFRTILREAGLTIVEGRHGEAGALLGILSVAPTALTRDQLEAFSGLPAQTVAQHLADQRLFLNVSQPEEPQRYTLFYQSLAEFLHRPDFEFYLPAEESHARIATYLVSRLLGE